MTEIPRVCEEIRVCLCTYGLVASVRRFDVNP